MGNFVVFEGLTASGKKTHIRILKERLEKIGRKVVTLSFPDYENEIARITKKAGAFDPFTLSLLYAADRRFAQGKIKKFLEEGNIVISDRYCYSNFAYQSANGVPLDWLYELEKGIIKPEIGIFIDVPVEETLVRVRMATLDEFTKKEIISRIERQRDVLEKVREIYLKLIKEDRETEWLIINGTKSIAENSEKIWNFVSNKLNLK